jgi:N-acetylneuraminate lyase
MKRFWMTGLVPATFTPMHEDGSLNLAQAGPIVEHLLTKEVGALFVCGSTGESASLTTEERKAMAAAYVAAAAGRVPVIVHVGHTSLADARDLAGHARQIGAAAFAALPPFYVKPASVEVLVQCMAQIAAAAPDLPFYYYHIPGLTGVNLDMVAFLRQAAERIPNLAGIKYSSPTLYEFQACLAFEGGRYNMLFGVDEMLLSGLASGAHGAVGSTYNFAAPLYQEIMRAFRAGELAQAQRLQTLSAQMVLKIVSGYRPLPGLKTMMKFAGLDCGPARLPQVALTPAESDSLQRDMVELGFLEWMR